MRSMLEFAFVYGRYCHREWQLKCFNPAADNPQLSVKALMKDDKEEIRRADMFCMYKTGMDIMGDDVCRGPQHRATAAPIMQDQEGDK